MTISDGQVNAIVRQVLTRVRSEKQTATPVRKEQGDWGVFRDMNEAVQSAHQAFLEFESFGIQDRKKFIDAVRQMTLDHMEEFSRMAIEQTKMGRLQHKIAKHIAAAKYTPGVEYLQPVSWSGKNGMAMKEFAPFGVIGNITPSTHPSAAMINGIITQVSAGNTIAFNPHPASKKLNAYVIQLSNQYMVKAGAPSNLVTCVVDPTLETADVLFRHPLVSLLSVTGGPGVVAAAMKQEKRVIAAGPGNPPVLIDETADVELAAKEITLSAGFDNNILCLAEKQIFVVSEVFDAFMRAFEKQGNVRLSSSQMQLLSRKALEKKGSHYLISRDFVGRNASVLARAIGVNISDDVPLLFGETEASDPWVVAEQMTPCLPVVRVRDFNEGLERAKKSEHGFRHTSSIFTQSMNRATLYTRKMNCSIGVVNGGTIRGDGTALGEGFYSLSIATPTGEGIVTPRVFCRRMRIMVAHSMRFV